MDTEAQLDELLERWEEARDGGTELPVDELCSESPELRDAVARRIEEIRWADQVLESSLDAGTPIEIPEKFGRYKLEELVGEGGFGQVWRGYDPELERTVAIKVLRPDRSDSVFQVARFTEEAKRVAQLRHPNIVPVYDVGRDAGFSFIVSAFIDGKNLRQCTVEGRISVESATRITATIADALQHAHEQGVIHRDIKPANILVANGEPFVTDFGIATTTNESGEAGLSGTPAYMSPEQRVESDTPVTAQTDIYSLGLVFYELLTGQPGCPSKENGKDNAHSPLPPPSSLNSQISRSLDQICMKALAEDPVDRFETAAEFSKAIHRNASGQRGLLSTWQLVATVVLAIIVVAIVYAARSSSSIQGASPTSETESVDFTPALHQFLAIRGRTYIGDFSKGLSRLANTKIAVTAGQTIIVTPMTTWDAGPIKGKTTSGEYLVVAIGVSDSPPREFHIVGERIEFTAKEPGDLFLGTSDQTTDDNYRDLLVELSLTNPDGVASLALAATRPDIETRIVGREFPGSKYICDDAPLGGVLVGLNVTLGKFTGFRTFTVVSSVQPVYDVSSQITLGQVFGKVAAECKELRAKDGYAVGGIEIAQGIDNLRLTYMKRREHDLDTQDQYKSEWANRPRKSLGRLLGGTGLPIVGIRANVGAPPNQEEYVNAIGIVLRSHESSIDTPFIGYRDFGHVERDVGPPGAWLVGFKLRRGSDGAISFLQPIYRRGDQVIEGQTLVNGQGQTVRVMAKGGYAIGALDVNVTSYEKKSAAIQGLRPVFMRIEDSGLVEDDSDVGDWIGQASEVAGSRLNCVGKRCVGVVTIEFAGVLRAIALTLGNSD